VDLFTGCACALGRFDVYHSHHVHIKILHIILLRITKRESHIHIIWLLRAYIT